MPDSWFCLLSGRTANVCAGKIKPPFHKVHVIKQLYTLHFVLIVSQSSLDPANAWRIRHDQLETSTWTVLFLNVTLPS